MKELHTLAAFVHGALVFGHALGLVYGVRRQHKLDAAIHAFALGFSLRAAWHHVKEGR